MDKLAFAWALLAVLLLVAELMAGTVYMLAWAAGAAAAAIVQWLGDSWVLAAIVGAVVVVLGSIWAHRVRARQPLRMVDPDLGGEVSLLRPLGAERWRVQFRGTEWDARVVAGGEHAAVAARGRVLAREANLLSIEVI